jgi:AcrR family transcriptional regulator
MRDTTPTDQEATRLPRGARRKRRTRDKLLRAAMALIAEKGVGGVAINEITEAADVGFGSFYNHFESKEALHDTLLEEVLEAFGEALQQLVESLDDPAEVLSSSIRCTMRQAREQPAWGQFLVSTGFSGSLFSAGLGRHLQRDLREGVRRGRFRIEDPFMALVMTGGTVIAAIGTDIAAARPGSAMRRDARALGLDLSGLAERTSRAVLCSLGIPGSEADEIARRPLPDIHFTPAFLQPDDG